jgi:threonylcarbamoyladenosine tRNA methylthiotransferase MtaB
MNLNAPVIHIITLGCKTNQCDSEELARDLARQGYQVELTHESELTLNAERSTLNGCFIVNTCTVTHTADTKARKLIRKLLREHPGAQVIATGCYAQRAAADLRKIGAVVAPREEIADLIDESVVGRSLLTPPQDFRRDSATADRREIPPYSEALPANRTRVFLKVQDGCNHACAYCVVHTVRGPMTSMLPDEVVARAWHLYEMGAKEVVLCGVHLGAYGIDLGGESLASLLQALRAVPLPRLRLSSLEPMDITDELVSELADHPSLCHHLHLPLQSGDDSVLAAMARGYTAAEYRERVAQVRTVWPELALTTDVMVGFPGETEAAFANTAALVQELEFSRLHIFRYSPRPGTPAAAASQQVEEITKRQRSEKLQALADELFLGQAKKLQGQVVEVLFEEKNAVSGLWEGLTPQYLRVATKAEKGLTGEILPVRIEGAEQDIMLGSVTS